jgi:hypothetical protein
MAELTALYGGACNLCRTGVALVPGPFPQVNLDEAMRLMPAVDLAGLVCSGTDAWARIGLTLPACKVIVWLFLVPGIHFCRATFLCLGGA